MMLLIVLTGAGALDNIMDGLHIPWGSYDENFVEICWVQRHQEPPQWLIDDISRVLAGVDDDFDIPD